MKQFLLFALMALIQAAGIRAHAWAGVPLTPEQKEKLAEGDRYLEAARRLKREGKLAEAIVAGEKLLAIERAVYGNEHEEVAATLEALTSLRERILDFSAAERGRREILRILIRCRGEKSWQAADARLDLKDLQVLRGLDSKGHQEIEVAHRWMDAAGTRHAEGDYREAVALAEKALEVRVRRLGEENRRQALDSANLLGLYLNDARQFKRARPYHVRVLAIRRRILGEDHPDTAGSWNNLGLSLSGEGNLAAARPCYEKALRAYKKTYGEEDPDTVNPLNNLANLLSDQGDFAGARTCYEQALAIRKKVLGDDDPATADSLNNLGALLSDMGDNTAALPYYEQALAIRKKVLGDDHIVTAGSLNNLGIVKAEQGDHDAARRYHEEALAIWKKTAGDNHPYVAVSLANVANLLVRQKKYPEAQAILEQALAIQERTLGAEHPDVANTLDHLGLLHAKLGKSDAAVACLERALVVSRRHLTVNASGQSEREQLLMVQMFRKHLDAYLSVSTAGNATADYAHVLAWKGAILARQQRLRLARIDPKLNPLFQKLSETTEALATLSASVPFDAKAKADWAKQLEDLSVRQQAQERELAAKSAAFREDQAQANLTPSSLLKSLPKDVVLVDYLVYHPVASDPGAKDKTRDEARLTAFVLRAGAAVVRLDLGPMSPIEEAIDAWRRVVKSQPGADHPGVALRSRLWLPLEKHLAEAKTVLISPDGALGRLPFAALPGRKECSYLLEEVSVAVTPVPRLLPGLLEWEEATKKSSEPSLLLVGDVNFDAAGTVVADAGGTAPTRTGKFQKWHALDGTRGEIVAIRDSFERKHRKGKITMLREEEATDVAVFEEAGNHRFLHIATHGFFAAGEVHSALTDAKTGRQVSGRDTLGKHGVGGFHPGLLSGLVLAGANSPIQPGQGDGILTALEVAELDLRKVDLAVLSACETGLGKVAGGEGVLGLQRSFQVGGAKSVVASLWKVQDHQTSKLMMRFYANLWHKTKPMTKLEALREAQLYMLREGISRGLVEDDMKDAPPERRLAPYYWAAFVLSGDWR